MTTILFIRHGQTNVNHMHKIQGRQNHLLNDTGRLQAKATGEYLKENDPNWDYIYSSPLDRAYETACIIRDELNLKVDVIKNEQKLVPIIRTKPVLREIDYTINDI